MTNHTDNTILEDATTNTELPALASADLDTVNGGIDRDTYVAGGKLAGGAAGGMAGAAAAGTLTAPTGPGAVAAAFGGRVVGGGIGQYVGGKVGGALWDAGTYLGDKAADLMYGKIK